MGYKEDQYTLCIHYNIQEKYTALKHLITVIAAQRVVGENGTSLPRTSRFQLVINEMW